MSESYNGKFKFKLLWVIKMIIATISYTSDAVIWLVHSAI